MKEVHTPKHETWRLRYLRILTGPAADAGNSQDDLQAIEDLVDEKLIRGSTIPNEQGEVRAAALVTGKDGLVVPTLKGRLFVEEQRAYLRSKTFLGRLKTNWPLFSGIIGIVVGWSLSLLTPIVHQRLHPTVPDSKSAYGLPDQSQPGSNPTASSTPR
jgi:hypothetical protein